MTGPPVLLWGEETVPAKAMVCSQLTPAALRCLGEIAHLPLPPGLSLRPTRMEGEWGAQ